MKDNAIKDRDQMIGPNLYSKVPLKFSIRAMMFN